MKRLAVVALIGAFLLVLPQGRPAQADAAVAGGDYVPFTTTTRVLDTRSAVGVPTTTPMAADSEKAFAVLGVGSVPSTGVTAVLADVTLLDPSGATLLRLWADGTPRPVNSVIHTSADNISNSVVIPVGTNGRARIYNSAGTAHAVIDVQGYFTTATTNGGTGGFVPITQTRVVDTRSDLGTTGGAIAPNGTRSITLATAGVPSNATAVYVNVYVPGATKAGSLVISGGTAINGGAVFDYVTGASSSGMAVKLVGGKATIRNSSAADAANVVIDIQGYFSPTATLGAGYRPAAGRIYDTRVVGTKLAGSTTVDVQVGGAAGLPVQGVAGALLNIHTTNTDGNVALAAWPTGSTRPGTSVNNNPGSITRANLNVVQPGTDGKISIRNLGTVATDVYVEIEGWFANPLAPVAIEANSPTAIVQATATDGAPRPLDFSYVNNSGQLVAGHVPNPDLANNTNDNTFQTLSGGEAFTGKPAIAEQANGNLVIAGHHTESNVWTKTETSKVNPPGWPDDWTKAGGSIRSHAAIGKLSDGRLVLFGLDGNGALWAISQKAANGAWAAWTNLGDVDLTGNPVVVTNPAGNPQIFARTLTGTVVTATYTGSLSPWTTLGSPGTALDATGNPAVAVGPTLIRVFVRTPAGDVATQQQNAGGAWPATWTSIAGAAAGGPPTAVVHPVDGTYQVFARTTDGRFQWATELTRNSGTWSTWGTYDGDNDGNRLISDPTALTWVGSIQKFGIAYRVGNDQTLVTSLATTTPPPVPTATAASTSTRAKKSSSGTTKTPEYFSYTAPHP